MNIGHVFSKKPLLSIRITAFFHYKEIEYTRCCRLHKRESKVYASWKRHGQDPSVQARLMWCPQVRTTCSNGVSGLGAS